MTGMFHSLYHRLNDNSASPAALHDPAPDSLFLDWPASYLDGFEDVDSERWHLELTGLVARPQELSLKDLMGFTRIQQNRRLVFADGWAFRAQWEGLVVSELLHRASPKPEAQFLIQTNAAGQVECLPLKDLYAQRALFCLRVAGKSLPTQYGGPLRLLVFDRYAHKGLGSIVKLELSETPVPGYYESKGYGPEAWIEPGQYYAADLKTLHTVDAPGEVTLW
jgi:DMSO/TMAO reductase YedYZ molybdopterin-dependent catalytic subunit